MDSGYAVWAVRWRVALGFAFGVAYLVFSQPTFPLLLMGGGIALVGLALRAFAAGYLEKNTSLATAGPYAYTRNPLYLGSFVLGTGFAITGGSQVLTVIFLLAFLAIYWPVMLRETESLAGRFGDRYHLYAQTVPLFFPFKAPRTSEQGETFRWQRYRNNREYQAALGYLAGIVFLVLKWSLR